MTKDEALKLALEALDSDNPDIQLRAAIIIKEVLAQHDSVQAKPEPEQKPVAWANRVIGGRKWLSIHASKGASDKWLEYRIKEQAQGEEYEQVALYDIPSQRKPLTRERLLEIADAQCGAQRTFEDWVELFGRCIEAAHDITGDKK